MKKLLIVSIALVLFLCSSCSKSTYELMRENSDYIFSTSSSFFSDTIYFDSFERVDNKIIFYDKNHKYAGEAYETENSFIERNPFKKED